MSKYSIITLDEVHSTNSYALEHLSSYDDKSVIYSPHQISGRGRYNRLWIADNSENVYMSFVLKPDFTSNYPYSNLTQYLSVIVCKCLEQDFNLKPEIKWPNDILIEGCKISGILAESSVQNNKINAIVLGLGLNVNLNISTIEKIDQKATSLSIIKNQSFDSEKIMRRICGLFFENYEEFISKGFLFIKNDYVSRCAFLGKNILIREMGEKKQYFAKSIDDDGLLIAIDEFNNECKIITGDVLC